MKQSQLINLIGTALLVSAVLSIVILFTCFGNGNYIANFFN